MPVYVPTVQAPVEIPLVASIPAKLARPEPEPPDPPAQTGVVVAWMLSVCVLVALSWSVVHWRNDVMSIWPPSERAYQALGLATP